MTAKDILRKLENRYVLIIGDVMLDRYLMGHVSRISPEAPVPVVLQQETSRRSGTSLVAAFVTQAGGEMTRTVDGGTRYVIRFEV